jgi:hypothetical protein
MASDLDTTFNFSAPMTTFPGEAFPQRTGAYTREYDLRAIVLPYKLYGEPGNEVSNHNCEFIAQPNFCVQFLKTQLF